MTPAERKRKSRAHQATTSGEAERRTLVARILRAYKSQLSKPFWDDPRKRLAADVAARNKEWLRSQHRMLLTRSLEELRTLSKSQQQITDGTGRLQGETSGGRTNDHLEKIDAARQSVEIFGGTRVNPTPDADDDIVIRKPKLSQDAVVRERQMEEAVGSLIVSGVCAVCHQPATEEHFRKFLVSAEKAQDVLDALNEMPMVPEQMKIDTIRTINNPHVRVVYLKMEQAHRDELARTRTSRKLEQLGRKAKREFFEERDLQQEEQSRREGLTP